MIHRGFHFQPVRPLLLSTARVCCGSNRRTKAGAKGRGVACAMQLIQQNTDSQPVAPFPTRPIALAVVLSLQNRALSHPDNTVADLLSFRSWNANNFGRALASL